MERSKKIKVSDWLSRDEISELMTLSNTKACWEVLKNWLWIISAFALVYFSPNIISYIIALFIIGGKQLGCSIIMHDCSHYALFKTKQQNIILGNILGAYPVFHNLEDYRPYHLGHHNRTGQEDDPDINLTIGYPTNQLSLLRKFARDLLGITGIKNFFGLWAMHLGYIEFSLAGVIKKPNKGPSLSQMIFNLVKKGIGPILGQIIIIGPLLIINAAELYALWILALFTTYNFSLRVRSMAEHSIVPNNLDNYTNVRTTYANVFEQLLFLECL